MPTVAILEPGYADYGHERAILEPMGARVVPVAAADDTAAAIAALDPVAILVRERAVPAAVLAAAPALRVVVRYGTGVDNIDVGAATGRRIAVANVPDYGAEHEVSDQALALYLALQRRVVSRDRQVRAGHWDIGEAEPVPGRLGATLGLIGCGRIGRAAARKFAAFGFTRTLVVDPHVDAATLAAEGFERADLPALCREADVVSLHTPLTEATRHIIGAAELALMKPTAILINVARGGLIDEPALAAALHAGRLYGAGLDVLENEPPAPDNPLLHTPNTVLSDHHGWYSERSVRILQTRAAEEVARVLGGLTPINWLNPWPDAAFQAQAQTAPA